MLNLMNFQGEMVHFFLKNETPRSESVNILTEIKHAHENTDNLHVKYWIMRKKEE